MVSVTRGDYRHAATRLSAAEWRAWQEGSIQIVDRDGRWVLTDLGMRRLGLLAFCAFLCLLMLLGVVL